MARNAELIAFSSRAGMAERIADLMHAGAASAVVENGKASVALSGGSTPALLYQRMANVNADWWSKIDLTLVDERWTPPGTSTSNETFIRDALNIDKSPPGKFLGLWSRSKSPEEGAIAASERFSTLKTPLDIAVLGMGEDGHTASWFPRAQGLEEALSIREEKVVYVRARPSKTTGEHIDRLTLTLGAIAHARLICLMIYGEDKRATFEKALEPGPVEDMPVRAILRARPNLWVCWAP